jgi:hypothetical protein
MKIVWTCTSSKRIDLFKKMMLSFYFTCLDIKLISEFICVDDGSSEEDFKSMQKMFPKIRFIKNQKGGQVESLRILLKNVKTDYIFHTEDDWDFLIQDNYITKCLDIMKLDNRIREVTLRFWDCIYVKQDNIDYRVHVFSPMDYKKDWDIIKKNDCTIGGLTLNPGLIHFDTFKECLKGIHQKDKQDRTWDRIIAKKFWDSGYKRANLNAKYINHTGQINSRYSVGV